MPTGELAGIGSSLTHAISSLVDKSLTRRLKPLTQASLAALGGSIFGILALLASGKFLDLPDVSVFHLVLSIIGGLTSAGIGFTLYLFFLGYVDVNKAAPLTSGITAILSVLSGLILLGEDLSNLTLIGIAVILVGTYTLSFSQRRDTESTQAMWLGVKGMLFLVVVTSFWVGGFTIQTIALKEVDVFTANAARMTVIFFFLGALNAAGVGRFLRLPGGEPAKADTEAITDILVRPKVERPPNRKFQPWKRNGQTRVLVRGPVAQVQIDNLKVELNGANVIVYDGEMEPSRGGKYLYIQAPRGAQVQSTLNRLAAVATATRVGRWPRTHQIELTLNSSSPALAPPKIQPAVTAPKTTVARPTNRPFFLPIINGFFSFGLGSLLLLIALDRVGLAVSFTLGNTSLLWIVLLSPIFLRERLTRKTMLGVGMTVVGVTLIVL